MSFSVRSQAAATLLAASNQPAWRARPCRQSWMLGLALLAFLANPRLAVAESIPGATSFHDQIQPILKTYCFDCHGDGAHKGNVAFDEFKSDQSVLTNRDLWW